jgi:hypothetical protein
LDTRSEKERHCTVDYLQVQALGGTSTQFPPSLTPPESDNSPVATESFFLTKINSKISFVSNSFNQFMERFIENVPKYCHRFLCENTEKNGNGSTG